MLHYPRHVDRVAFDPVGMSVAATTFRKYSSAAFVAVRLSRQRANKYLLHLIGDLESQFVVSLLFRLLIKRLT